MTKFVWHKQEIINMLERQKVTYSLPTTFGEVINYPPEVYIFIFKGGRKFKFRLKDNILTCTTIDLWLPEIEGYRLYKRVHQELADIKHLYFFLRKWGVIKEGVN